MRCLVLVKFEGGGALPPEEFFARINARWSWLGGKDGSAGGKGNLRRARPIQVQAPSSAICIAECESLQALSRDLAIMPGAGISSVEVFPVSAYKAVSVSVRRRVHSSPDVRRS